MIIFPAIDIIKGKPVRLFKGDFSTAEQVADDVLETADGFVKAEFTAVKTINAVVFGKFIFLAAKRELRAADTSRVSADRRAEITVLRFVLFQSVVTENRFVTFIFQR